ncbi:ornithine cyclodeaminase family protein, partial [PVC group bacterium]|nr:ornithine cyclodeaminase family protein [PVC group bacterium]
KKNGRTNQIEISVFDSTGLAIQDGAVGRLIYKKALEKKIGKYIQFLDTLL